MELRNLSLMTMENRTSLHLVAALLLGAGAALTVANDKAMESVIPAGESDASVGLRLNEAEGRLTILVESRDALTYRFGPDEALQYFYPVRSPSGRNLTVRKTEPWSHHRSLWISDKVGFPDEPPVDFYHAPRIYRTSEGYQHFARHQGFSEIQIDGSTATVAAGIQWLIDGARPVIDERRRWTVTALGAGEYLVDLEWELIASHSDVRFASDWTHYGWPYVRMHPRFSGENDGTIVNDRNERGQDGTNGRQARWIDYSNTVDGKTEGLTIFLPDGEERRWLTREYGTFGPRRPAELDGTGFTLERGESLRGRAGILVHRGDVEEGRVAERYLDYVRQASRQMSKK